MKTIIEQFPQQFEGGEYFLGISIDAGWHSIVIDACQQIQDSLSPSELELFAWVQIKEKFGGLQMYWGPHNVLSVTIIGPDNITNIEVESKSTAPGFTQETVDKINGIVGEAQRRASQTCEICGDRGRIYQGAYWRTLCDQHAHKDGHMFPAAYGEFVECHPYKQLFGSHEAISTRAVYIKGCGGRVWDWIDSSDKSFMLTESLPEALVEAYLDAKAKVHGSFNIPYSDPDHPDEFSSFAINDFLATVKKIPECADYFTLPKDCLRDTRTQLERDIESQTGNVIKTVARIDLVPLGGFAAGKNKRGAVRVFSIADKYRPELVTKPTEAIKAEIERVDRVREQLVRLLKIVEEA
jgi:hypothetical protein